MRKNRNVLLLCLGLVFVAATGCGGRAEKARSRAHTRVEVATLLDFSKASPVDLEMSRRAAELVAELLASGEEGRAWAATLGEDASSLHNVLQTTSAESHRRGAGARKAASKAKRDEIVAAFVRAAEAASAGKPLKASLIAEGATLLAREFGKGDADRILLLFTDGRQFSRADGIDAECAIPNVKSWVRFLDKRHLIPESSLQGVTVVVIGVGVTPVDGHRCQVSIASLDALEANWRATFERAGAEVFFFSSVPNASEFLPNRKDS
ncbi:MAG: hypothetical protein ABIQ65_06415 [Thermoanaerobaculia bacterium]